jgi:DNA-binding CsgD family transcriptional regulator
MTPPGFVTRREEALALALKLTTDGPAAPAEDRSVGGREAGPLGQRQAEGACLIAEGLSNKQIAARLLISQHTVDTHIRNIMTKLGCRSRAQIAAWVASGS